MKTQFLKDLGLEKEVIDKILAENGRDIETEKAKTTDLQTQLDTANKTIKERNKQLETLKNSTGNIEELKKQIETLQNDNKAADEEHAKEIKRIKVENALNNALSAANAKNSKAVKALLELGEDVELEEDGRIKGLDEKIKALKKSDSYLFEEIKKTTTITGAHTASNPNNQGDPGAKKDSEKTYDDFVSELEAKED